MRVALFLAGLLLCACDRSVSTAQPGVAQIAVSAKPQPNKQAIASAAAARLDSPVAPLSAMAQLGREIFFDPALSVSGKMSCASCHNPAFAYAPGNALAAQLGGPNMLLQGGRAVPSLTYLERTPRFSVRPDTQFDPDERIAKGPRAVANAQPNPLNPTNAAQIVPVGGMDWDGRAATLADQASGPLFDSREMANHDAESVVAKLKAAPYAGEFAAQFPEAFRRKGAVALDGVYQALARFQIEDRSFHRYDSKFDYWLAGRAQLSEQEMRGMLLFDDPKKGNCATCHLDKPTKNRMAPVFTDYEFEALGAPRNKELSANRDASHFDEGLCGPLRQDMAGQQGFCGMFKTPTLRNVATRQVFFHNGVFHSLQEVLRFYVQRETRPEKWYPQHADGSVEKYDDLPTAHRVNVDLADAPFNQHRGDQPVLNNQEIEDIVAFLKILNDGYRPLANAPAQMARPD